MLLKVLNINKFRFVLLILFVLERISVFKEVFGNLIKDRAFAILKYCPPKNVFEKCFEIISSNEIFDNLFLNTTDSEHDTENPRILPEDFIIDKNIFENILIDETPVKKEVNIPDNKHIIEMIAFPYGKNMVVLIFNEPKSRINVSDEQDFSNTDLKFVFDESPEATILCDSDWVIKDVNRSTLDLFRTSKDNVSGKKLLEVFIGNFGKRLVRKTDSIKTGQSYSFQQTFTSKGKNKLFLEIITKKIKYLNKHVIMIVFRDISFRRIQEEKLKQAKQEAEKSDKLKTAFLSNMSHEIRTPMNAILGFSDLLTDPNITAESQEKYIQLINNSSNVLLTIIEDIVDVARIEANEIKIRKESCDLHELLNNIYEDYRLKKEKAEKPNLDLILSPFQVVDSPLIYTDPHRLQQVITNLLGNALKFTNEGSIEFGYQITLTEDPQLSFDHVSNHLEVIKFFVKDTGIGLKPEEKELIFERFRQARFSHSRATGGTGLGLTISKTLINLFGGKIWVDSSPGKGSDFYFTIPYEMAPEPITEIESVKTDVAPGMNLASKTILVAEDDEVNYHLIEEVLKYTNAKILWAKNGTQSVELMQKHPETDLILMDIRMPEMDGYQATKKIKQINSEIPIIVQTAFAMVDEKQKSFDAGCDDYLAKPLNTKKLLGMISTYLC